MADGFHSPVQIHIYPLDNGITVFKFSNRNYRTVKRNFGADGYAPVKEYLFNAAGKFRAGTLNGSGIRGNDTPAYTAAPGIDPGK